MNSNTYNQQHFYINRIESRSKYFKYRRYSLKSKVLHNYSLLYFRQQYVKFLLFQKYLLSILLCYLQLKLRLLYITNDIEFPLNESYIILLSLLVKYRQWIFDDIETLKIWIQDELQLFRDSFGILSLLYSIVMTKGLENIQSEREDLMEPLIDATFGHARSRYNLPENILCGSY